MSQMTPEAEQALQPTDATGGMVAKTPPSTWLDRWEPEDQSFWESEGRRIAWRTLSLTTVSIGAHHIAAMAIDWWYYARKGWEKPS